MDKEKRQRLLVQVAKLYYEEGMGQEKIAQIMNLSRPYVSKLLNAAREEGIVRIYVIDPLNIESSLEAEFRERFHLRKAIIVPREASTEPLEHIGESAARYLNEVVEENSVIGTAWGKTLLACSKALTARPDLHNVVQVQVCGGVSNLNQGVYASNIADNFATLMGVSSYVLPVPAVVETKEVASLLMNEPSVADIMKKGMSADIELFTGGAFGHRSALYRAGYIDDSDLKSLSDKGAVGDVASHVINIRGEICDRELDERTMAVPLESIRSADTRICVAQGYSKVNCVLGVLNGGIANVLVTDEETAEWILTRSEELDA